MRILMTNPDGIGDTVLRLPLFVALRAAGHELMIVARGHAVPLLERGVEGAVIVELRGNPYEETRDSGGELGGALVERVRAFLPELLVFGPYQWTILEERLAAALAGTAVVRMNGYRFEQERTVGVAFPGASALRVVAVGEYWHECMKNEALAEGILGGAVKLGVPRIEVTAEDVARGEEQLAGMFPGKAPERFWFGCMGTTGDYYGNLKDWGGARWAEAVRYLVREKGQGVVLVGSDAERASLEGVREESGVRESVGIATGDAGEREGFSRLVGLAALSSGYFGRDTGPMHIAGAVGKPVVAVFGGGMWPRFTPMAVPSRAMAVDLPCAPCRWVCHLPESWCVKRVPVEAVMEALDAVISGELRVREARLIPASPALYEAARRM